MSNANKQKLSELVEELDYRIDFRIRNLHPGKWPASGRYSSGFSFEKFERLSNHPDFRKIDFLATSRNPLLQEPLVRVFKSASRVDLIMLADLSLSLSCWFSESKLFQIAKLSTIFGYSAFRFGDRFGFIGFDNKLLNEFYWRPIHSRTLGLEIGEMVLDFHPSAPSRGLTLKDLEKFLPEKKSLVIFVSDFYLEPKALRAILKSLRRHRVLPIILRQENERHWPRGLFGILRLKDSESGREEMLLVTSRTIKKFKERTKRNEEGIRSIFNSFSVIPTILDRVTPVRLLNEIDRSLG